MDKQIKQLLFSCFVFLVQTCLVGNSAGSLACRLAGILAFPAAFVLKVFFEVPLNDRFYVFHVIISCCL